MQKVASFQSSRFPQTSQGLVCLLLGVVVAIPLSGMAQDKGGKEAASQSTNDKKTKSLDANAKSAASKKANAKSNVHTIDFKKGVPGFEKPITDTKGLVKLAPKYEIYVDFKRKCVIIDGEICLTRGQLEMFACPENTKEHESIVALKCRARFVHAALLAVGAKAEHPVRFRPEYRPAKGSVVDVLVQWQDKDGKWKIERAQKWVRNLRTKKVMQYPYVFGGSGFWTDEETGERYYHADAGDLICVSNFPTATLDVPVRSSQETANLLYEAFTENIPPKGTKVRVLLVPRQTKKASKKGSAKKEATKKPAKKDVQKKDASKK